MLILMYQDIMILSSK